ncbi:plasmid recombination protein, partial [Staphylococcus epidermidis]|uniref:plasmid recombination protein n=1 Tax=Staphylococcus epidermidis TaxID=1282 RepID=UPI0037DA07A8
MLSFPNHPHIFHPYPSHYPSFYITQPFSNLHNHTPSKIIFPNLLQTTQPHTNQKPSPTPLNFKLPSNTQKNKITHLKPKHIQQQPKPTIKNHHIHFKPTNLNFHLLQHQPHFYHPLKHTLHYYKQHPSPLHKNTLLIYSNIITLSKQHPHPIPQTPTKHYFNTSKHYFTQPFPQPNLLSPKLHIHQSPPHIHLHFIPLNHQPPLSPPTPINPQPINHIHHQLTTHLSHQPFHLQPPTTHHNKTYIQHIHQYKNKPKLLTQLHQQIQTKKQFFTHINHLHHQKQHLTPHIQNLKPKNHFLQHHSQHPQQHIHLYNQLTPNSTHHFQKHHQNYQKQIKPYHISLTPLTINYP